MFWVSPSQVEYDTNVYTYVFYHFLWRSLFTNFSKPILAHVNIHVQYYTKQNVCLNFISSGLWLDLLPLCKRQKHC